MRLLSNVRSIAIGIAVVVLVIVLLLFSRPELHPFSAQGVGPNGLKGMALLLEELGYNVLAWDDPFDTLAVDVPRAEPSDDKTLLIVSLPHVGVTEQDFDVLQLWVEQGHSVVLLGRDVALASILWDRYEFTSVITRERNLEEPVWEVSDFAHGIQSLHTLESHRFILKHSSPAGQLIRDAKGVIAVSVSVGEGRLFAVSDGMLHGNRQINKADNVTFLVGIVQATEAREVWIAEPRALPTVTVTDDVERNPIGVRHLYLTVLIALWAVGRRFGPPIPLPADGEALSMPDYVRGVASLYQRGRVHKHAVKILYDDLMQVVAAQIGPSSNMENPHAQAVQLACRRGLAEAPLLACLNRCSAIIEGAATGEGELVKLADEIERYRRALIRTVTH